MVSVAEKDGLASQDNTPPTKLPMDFPSWTRAEESDGKDRDARLSILHRRSRKWNNNGERKREHGVAHAADPGQRPSRLDSRGLFKDIAQPVVSGIFDALSPHDGPESSDDEKHNKSKGTKQPAPIQTQPPPELPAPKSPESPKSPKSPKSPTLPAYPTPSSLPVYSTASPLPPPPPPVSNPGNPKPTEAVVNPIQPPPGYTLSDSSYGPSMRLSTLTPSAPTTRPTTTTKVPPLLLTPIVTLPVPVPALSSGARKGVNLPPTSDAVLTFSTSMSPMSPMSPTSPTSSSSVYPTPNSDSAKGYYHDHDHDKGNIHPKVEMALVALGSIGSSIIVAFIGWLVWRCHKRRRANGSSRAWKPHFPQNMPTDKPKLLVTNTLARIPILKNRMADRRRRWTNLDQADLGPFSEKAYVAQSLATQQPPLSGVAVQTDFVRTSIHADVPQNGATLHVPKVSISSTEPQAGSTLRSGAQLPNTRLSDISSLSSGFGDGQFMIDTLSSGTNYANNTASETTVKAPLPVARRESVGALSQRRDTVYTEASEDTPARFRSVNSWVRQQTGRVTRATQRNQASDAPPVPALPPEQDFDLMMPDGEEPRRADSVTGHGVAR